MNAFTTISKQINGRLTKFHKFNSRSSQKRFISNVKDSERQNELFIEEQTRQKENVGRIEKIEVKYEGPQTQETLVMNKNISTPWDCAKHLGETVWNKAVVGLLNGESLWHMHRPLPESCKLEFLHYHSSNPSLVNKAYWRSCSFLLGAVISDSFKDNVKVHLHSFPSPNVKSGSFIYDVQLSLNDWQPTEPELKVLSLQMIKFCQKDHPIECLNISKDLALEMFRNNPHKTKQIPDIARHNNDKITLYKVDKHIDISRGPMVPDTGHLGRITVSNVIKLDSDIPGDPMYRFQGVSLPKCIVLNHYAYGLLEERAKILNSARIPGAQEVENEDNSFVATLAQ